MKVLVELLGKNVDNLVMEEVGRCMCCHGNVLAEKEALRCNSSIPLQIVS